MLLRRQEHYHRRLSVFNFSCSNAYDLQYYSSLINFHPDRGLLSRAHILFVIISRAERHPVTDAPAQCTHTHTMSLYPFTTGKCIYIKLWKFIPWNLAHTPKLKTGAELRENVGESKRRKGNRGIHEGRARRVKQQQQQKKRCENRFSFYNQNLI